MVASLGLTQESFEKEKQALQEQKRIYEAALRQVVNKVANTVPSLLTNYICQTVPHFLLLTSVRVGPGDCAGSGPHRQARGERESVSEGEAVGTAPPAS